VLLNAINGQLFSYFFFKARTIDVCFVPDQHAQPIYSANSLRQHSAVTHVAPIVMHYTDFEPTSLYSYSFILNPYEEAENTNLIVFGLTLPHLRRAR
jgi:hypothetical protein